MPVLLLFPRMLRVVRSLSAALVATLGTVPVVAADTLHVPGDYPTIQGAIDAATDGDEVIVSQGIYTENLVLKSGVDVRGIEAARTQVLAFRASLLVDDLDRAPVAAVLLQVEVGDHAGRCQHSDEHDGSGE